MSPKGVVREQSPMEDLDFLRYECSALSPEQQEAYGSIEDHASGQFVDLYGEYLTPEQRDFFLERRVLIVEHSVADSLWEQWEDDCYQVTAEKVEIGSMVYTGYRIGDELSPEGEHLFRKRGGSIIKPYYRGKFVVYPLDVEEIIDVSTKWLMYETAYDQWKDKIRGSEDEDRWVTLFGSIQPFSYSNAHAVVCVHEKVHLIQGYNIPLPIIEASAHYYQREVARAGKFHEETCHNMRLLADLFEDCLTELGDDLHRLMFGNIEDVQYGEELIRKLKLRFTNEEIQKRSKGDYQGHNIYWDVVKLEELQQREK